MSKVGLMGGYGNQISKIVFKKMIITVAYYYMYYSHTDSSGS